MVSVIRGDDGFDTVNGSGPPVVATANGIGTVTLQQSKGIASITDVAVGKYQFNFSSNFSAATYFANGVVSYSTDTYWEYLSNQYTGGNLDHIRTTSQCKVGSYSTEYVDAGSVGLMASE